MLTAGFILKSATKSMAFPSQDPSPTLFSKKRLKSHDYY